MGQRLGQHFLKDVPTLMEISELVERLAVHYELEHCVEIGAGEGALTRFLVPAFDHKILIEKDRKVASELHALIDKDTEIVWGDVLEEGPRLIQERLVQGKGDKIDLSRYMVVGNLPYYITSPIFRAFLVETQVFEAGVFLVQDEVAGKLQTDARKKSFLWRLVNYYYSVSYEFTVDKNKFSPPPKVQSAVVSFERRDELPEIDFDDMVDFLDLVNPYSRKTLGKISKMENEAFSERGYNVPDDLSIKRVEKLTREELGRVVYGE